MERFSEIESETDRKFYAKSHRFVGFLGRIVGLKVIGIENVPQMGGALIACKHTNGADILIIPISVPDRHVTMWAKKEMFNWPVLGKWITRWGAKPITREAPERSELKGMIEVLMSGRLAATFPEGTRVKKGVGEFKEGTRVLSKRAKVPTIPAAIRYPSLGPLRLRRPVIAYGAAIDPPHDFQSSIIYDRELFTSVKTLHDMLE